VAIEFLSDDQAAAYGRFTGPPERAELERFFFLDDADRALVGKRRGDHNRLGFSLRLGTGRFIGLFLPDPLDVPPEVVDYLAGQLGIADASSVKRYAERQSTQWEHAAEIRQAYGYRDFTDDGPQQEIRAFIAARAWTRTEGPRALFDQSVAWLRGHISAPCHFHEGAPCLNQLPEKFFGLRPLIVINVKPLIASRHGNGDFFITTSYIQDWLKTSGCGAIPQDSYVVLYTGLSSFYPLGNQRVPGLYNDYYDDVPGFDAASTKWLWQHGALGTGADTFGPDATMDQDFRSTDTITGLGGITLENMGPGLAQMRACGDWIEINGPRLTSTSQDQLGGSLDFSGAWMGMDGWTLKTS
jgi:kynurenine formamidase